MVNDKYVVKYLDPRTGKYEYATVKDIGDLQKLNTKVKTSIVDAINSISADDIEGLKNGLDTIGKTIKSLEDGTLELGDFQSIDDVVSREIEDAINSLKDENSGLLKLTQEEIDKIISDAESEYRDSIAASVRELETSKSDLEDAREKMNNIGKMLENADIDYSNLSQVVDDINLYITDVIEKTDFDMVNGIVSDYKTAVTQTQDGWGVDASRNMLSYLTGRVKSNETSLDVQHGLIQAKVGKDEFQYMTVDNLPAGKENMLHNTSDLRDWNFSSAFIFKSADDYRFTSIVQSDSAGENIMGTTDELEQGVTYAISTYVNVQNKNKEPDEEKYAPTDGNYTATVIIDGDTIELNNVVEDNSALDGWKRVSGTFIAKRTAQQDIKFYVTSFNRNTQVGYLSAPKLEKGSSATSWIPHIEDNVSTILSQNAVMRVLSDRITSSVEEVRETKGAFETATSTFNQMADGFELNTNKLSEVLDKYGEVTGVQTQQASELKVLNESITSKVWKQDINTTLDTINIDTSNRIVNSAFNIYSYDEQTGALKLDYWDNNTGFAIKKHSQSLDNYLYAKRSNATSVNPISIKSSPFALRDGEKILFNFEYLAVGNPLDNDNVFTLEMYDNDDVRVGLQEFRLSELKKEFLTAYDVGDSYKYNGSYIVKNSSVVKGTITLKLPKNGELWLTKIMLQNAGIGTIGWTPSSIDNQIIQSKLSTEINQLADSIELVAKDERLDAISGLLVKKDGKITISPEAIVSRVTAQELGDNALITQTSLTQTEDNLRFDLVDKDGIIQTINASADGLLIDFDKVQIDGEVIARMISAQSIDATQGFRLTDNNGNTLLSVVNDNGKPTLNIAKEFRVKFGEVNDKLDVTIVGVVEEYYYSVDPDEPIGGRWTSTPNAFQGGDNRFIWKRTKIIYQSGDTSYYPSETGINITGSWEYEKESVTAEVVKALDSAETAKELAVSEANQAMIDANKYADEQDALIRQQVETSVSDAISKSDQAKQAATDSYNNAVAKAEELTQAQSEAFNKKFEENESEMGTISKSAKDAEAKAQSALSKAGTNANTLTTHQNTLNTINNTTIPNVNKVATDAMAEAKSALSSAGSAMDEAKKADGKIADYVTKNALISSTQADNKISDFVTKNGLVNGTTVDSKIDTATGEISKKITTVESKIPTEIGGRNLLTSTASASKWKTQSYMMTAVINNTTLPTGEVGEVLTIGSNEADRGWLRFPYDKMENDKEYTFSIWIKRATAGNGVAINMNINGEGHTEGGVRIIAGQEWKRVKITKSVTNLDILKFVELRPETHTWEVSARFYLWHPQLETGSIMTDWSPAPEDNYTREEFSIFESTYDEDVKGINSTLTELSNSKVDGTTYTNFYNNEYKKTAQGVTDTYNKVNKIIDANGNSTDAFAKAVYDRNATRQTAAFNEVTKDLVKEATYTAGIDGISKKITAVEGKIGSDGNNLYLNSEKDVKTEYKHIFINTYNIPALKDNVGKRATISFDARILSDKDNHGFLVYHYQESGLSIKLDGGKESIVVTQDKQRFIFHGDIVNNNIPTGRSEGTIIIYDSSGSVSIEVSKIKIELGEGLGVWSPAPEDNYSKEEFKIFESTYDETVKGINSTLTDLSSKKLDGTTYTNFYNNEYKQTAKGVTDAWTAVNKIVDANGNSTDTFAKAVYEKNATSRTADFKEVTKDLVTTATYSEGVKGINQSIATVRGDLENLKISGTNLIKQSDTPSKWDFKTYQFKNEVTTMTLPNGDTGEVMEIGSLLAGSGWMRFYYYDMKLGEEYTFSVWIKRATSGTGLATQVNVNGEGHREDSARIVAREDWERIKVTRKVTRNPSTFGFVEIRPESYTWNESARFHIWHPQLERGNIMSDWSQSPEDLLGKADFQIFKGTYENNDQTIKNRLTSIDSGKEGSILYKTNEALSTAQGNTRSITTLDTKVDNLKVGGRNYFKNSDVERTGSREFVNHYTWNMSPVINEFGTDTYYTVSFDIKSKVAGNINVYAQNGNGTKYSIGTKAINVSTTYKRFSYTFKPELSSSTETMSMLAFFGTYESGRIPTIKNVKFEVGNFATDWTPAPEDMLGKETFTLFKNDYDETAESVERRLTAIDSSEEGSVVTRLNATIKTAGENKNTISKVNKIVTIQDTRSDNQSPKWYRDNYPRTTVQEFKAVTAIKDSNIPFTTGFGVLTTTIVWENTTGGTVQQVFTINEKRYVRRGWTDDTGWIPWAKMTDQEDIKNFVDSTSTEYQTITERSNLYERVIGKDEAGVKSNISRIVATSDIIQTEVAKFNGDGTNIVKNGNFSKLIADSFQLKPQEYGFYVNGTTSSTSARYYFYETDGMIEGDWYTLGFEVESGSGNSISIEFNDIQVAYIPKIDGWGSGRVYAHFKFSSRSSAPYAFIDFGLNSGAWFYVRNIAIKHGKAKTPFSIPVSEGIKDRSTITQLSDNINLKVSKDDISNQININTQGVVIDGSKIKLTGQTSVDGAFWAKEVNAVKVKADSIEGTTAQFTSLATNILKTDVITSNMIKADTALFDMLFSTQSATNRLSARDAWITNANIVSLDASKITTGTIDAGRLNAGAIVTSGLSANVIKSEHILGSTALIDKIFAQDAYITRLTGKTAFISSIKAIDLSASRITSGTLDASKITVSNLSASSLTTGTLDANRVTINNLSASRITSGTLDASKVTVSNLDASSITANQADLIKAGLKGSSGGSLALSGDQILSTASDGSQVYIQNGLVGTRNPQGATIGQLGYMFDGSSPTYIMRTSLGSHFALNQTFNDTYNGVTTSKEKETIRIMAGGTQYINRADRMDLYSNVYFQQQVSINGANDLAMSGGNINNPYGIYFQHGGRLYTLSGGTATRLDGSRELQFQVNNVRKMQLDTTRNYMYQPLNMQGNGIFEQSDERIKENIREISQNSLEIIKGTRFANYEMIKDGRSTFGFIAQQLQTVAPHLIFEEDGRLTYDTVEWTQTVAHGLQQLNNKVDENDNKVNNIIKKLESKIEMLELELKRARG